jgi:hypothetical protein
MKTQLLLIATLTNFTAIASVSADVGNRIEDRLDHKAERVAHHVRRHNNH